MTNTYTFTLYLKSSFFLYGEGKQFERMRMDVRGHLGSPSQRCQELKTDRADGVDRQRGQHWRKRGYFMPGNEIDI